MILADGSFAPPFDLEQTVHEEIVTFNVIRWPIRNKSVYQMTISEIQEEHRQSKQNELDQLLRDRTNLEKEVHGGAPKEVLEARLIGLNKRIAAAQTLIRTYESQSPRAASDGPTLMPDQ